MEHTERCRYFAIYLKEYFMRYWNVLNWPVIKVQSQNAFLVVECDFQQLLHYPFLHPFVFHLAETMCLSCILCQWEFGCLSDKANFFAEKEMDVWNTVLYQKHCSVYNAFCHTVFSDAEF